VPTRKIVQVLAIVAASLAPCPASFGQDIFSRGQGGSSSQAVQGYRSPDRLDLRVGATYPVGSPDQKYAQIGLQASIGSDFACGHFDLHANLKNLMTKEAGKEMMDTVLGAVESELMYNALVLACETSPTACQAIQHFRVNANSLLGVGYNRCQAVENGIRDGLQGARARSIKDCMDQKQQQGVTDPNEALRACQNATTMSGLTGLPVQNFSLGTELEKALGLPAGESQNLQRLLSSLRITPTGATGSIQAEGVIQEYTRIENDFAQAWTDAIRQVAQNPGVPLDPDAAKKLQPENSPGPLPINVQDIAELPADQQTVFIRWIAGLMAMTTLEARVQKIERYLLAASKVPTLDKGTVEGIEKELTSLRMQMRHVDDQVKRQDSQNQALLRVIAAAEALKRDRAASSLSHAQAAADVQLNTDILAPAYGAPRRPAAPPPPGPQGVIQGAGCTNCPSVRIP
jgi:hypothetical protein